MLKGGTVFLLDVDNTLLDNDRFSEDLGDQLQRSFGPAERVRYWELFNQYRERHGLADYLATLQEFRHGLDDHPRLLTMSAFLLEYPFASLLFPGALAAIAHLRTLGLPVILSDGDIVFQPRKIARAGIWDCVEGRVLIYRHKEQVLDQVRLRHPAVHYVMVDDKPQLLAAMKRQMRGSLTTVFVRQGHYARAAQSDPLDPAPDLTIERIGDLLNHPLSNFQVPA